MTNPLTTTSIILHLEIQKWAGEVSDKKALKAVADTFNSDTHNDKYKKSLFVTDPLSMIDRCAGRLRNHFYASTYSWLDNGKGRLIPSMDFQGFAIEHSKLKQDFYNEVEQFLAEYEEHKEEAKRKKGDLFNEGEYPTVEQLRTRFEINLTTLPFPNIDDFRITAPEEVIDELQKSMEDSVTRVQHVVSTDIRLRLEERLQMLVKTLKFGKRFSKSLLTELEKLVASAYNLQDTIEKRLYEDLLYVEKNILKYTPETLRNSQNAQDEVIEICNSILSH